MAGTGPPPKKSRSRSGTPTRGDWVSLGAAPAVVPRLPSPAPEGGWSVAAKREWRRWWSSPVASMWGPEDLGLVELLLWLTEGLFSGGRSSSSVGQWRQLRDQLGLTPKGRQDRRWLLPSELPVEVPRRLHAVAGEDPR